MFQPSYKITPYLLNLIAEAAALRALIDRSSLKLSWLPVLQSEARRKSAHSSTAIEGNPLSLAQVKAIDQGQPVKTAKIFELEVANYLRAMRWIQRNVKRSIGQEQLLELHSLLTRDILDEGKCGKYKARQNYVVNEKQARIYTPPSPKATPKLIKEMCQWLNSKEVDELHSIIVCAILHHRLVSIHPFSDGNGRIARALGSWVMYKREFDTNHIFSLDEFFAADRRRYYLKIQQARDLDDNLTHWIEYVAEGVVPTLQAAKQRIDQLELSSLADIELSPRQEELINLLKDRSPLSVSFLQKEMGLTRARINQILPPLLRNGIVIKDGQSRATRYRLK